MIKSRRRMVNRRVLFLDPAPLPPDAPAFVDDFAEYHGTRAQERASRTMAVFDQSREPVRRVATVTGDLGLARFLVTRGVRNERAAERELMVRREAGWL